MLVYQAELAEGAVVTAVSARPLRADPPLGAGRVQAVYRVTVRYALPDGQGGARRGRLHAALPMGTALTVAGYHQDGRTVVVSLRPAGAPRPGRGVALADRFRLPLALQAWGVTAVTGADLRVDGVLRAGGATLTVRGAVHMDLRTPSGGFALRIPFARVLAVEAAVPGLRWRLRAGVFAVNVRVEPGGRVVGDLLLALRAEGRPLEAGTQTGSVPLDLVREVAGEVRGLIAEAAGAGQAVVRGTVELDVYGMDRRGRSRWTGRSLPFSALVELVGTGGGDRLEATAAIERLTHAGGQVLVLLAYKVTALRPVTIVAGDGERYRVERVAAAGGGALALREPLFAPEGVAAPTEEGEVAVREMPLTGPGAWSDLAVVLHKQEGGGAGRWRVQAALEGTPAGDGADPVSLRASAGGTVSTAGSAAAPESLAVVPALVQVDGGGLRVETALGWGPPLPELTLPHPGAVAPGPLTGDGAQTGTDAQAGTGAQAPSGVLAVSGSILAPGPIRRVVRLAVSPAPGRQLTVEALLGLEGFRHLVCVAGRVPGPAAPGGRLVSALAYPVLHGDRWQLHVTIICQPVEG